MKTVRLDRFGRVVIPKRARVSLGLEPGSVLEVTESAEGIVLTPRQPGAHVRAIGGVLVFTGAAEGDLEGAVRRQREERTLALKRRGRR